MSYSRNWYCGPIDSGSKLNAKWHKFEIKQCFPEILLIPGQIAGWAPYPAFISFLIPGQIASWAPMPGRLPSSRRRGSRLCYTSSGPGSHSRPYSFPRRRGSRLCYSSSRPVPMRGCFSFSLIQNRRLQGIGLYISKRIEGDCRFEGIGLRMSASLHYT